VNAHILIVNPQGKVLLLKQDSWVLPLIPSNQRHSEVKGIGQAIQKQLGLQVAILFCLQDKPRVYIAESLGPNTTPPNGRWFSKEELARIDSVHGGLLARHAAGKLLPITPPWARIGWYSKTEKWILEKLRKNGMPATGPIEQVKLWNLSSVLRIPTDQGWAWFKAVPSIFSQEPGLVRYLNKKYPGSVPSIISTNSSKGWLLTRDIGGRSLCDFSDPEYWCAVIKTYALLQQEEIPYAEELAFEFVIPGGLQHLIRATDFLTQGLIEMAAEGYLPMSDAAQWGSKVQAIMEKCRQLAAFSIPETLEHGDLYCGNININSDRVVFFDWTDGSISHPFFSLDSFLNECEFSEEIKEQIVSTYLLSWALYLKRDMDDILAAWELAAPLALVHQTFAYYKIMRSLPPKARWQAGNSLANLVRIVLKEFQ
jgi:hypothetical protein